MAESFLTTAAGNIHTWTRVISANTVHDQGVFPAEYPGASYIVFGGTISIATADAHVLELLAGSSLNLKVRCIHIEQSSNANAAALGSFSIFRLSTAGTGGSAITPAKFDTSDSAAGATGMSLASSKGTETTELFRIHMPMRQAISATQAQVDDQWEWIQKPGQKPLVVAAGTSNGLCIKSNTAVAGGAVDVWFEFVEQAFV